MRIILMRMIGPGGAFRTKYVGRVHGYRDTGKLGVRSMVPTVPASGTGESCAGLRSRL